MVMMIKSDNHWVPLLCQEDMPLCSLHQPALILFSSAFNLAPHLLCSCKRSSSWGRHKLDRTASVFETLQGFLISLTDNTGPAPFCFYPSPATRMPLNKPLLQRLPLPGLLSCRALSTTSLGPLPHNQIHRRPSLPSYQELCLSVCLYVSLSLSLLPSSPSWLDFFQLLSLYNIFTILFICYPH